MVRSVLFERFDFFWPVMAEINKPPCIAAQVTPPVVRPVRKIAIRFIVLSYG
jgi:hypothetical protein